MTLLPFHPFASVIYPTHDDSLFLSGTSNCASWHQHQPSGIRLQRENDEVFVYAIDAPGIQSEDKWSLNVEKTDQETIIRLGVVDHQEGSIANRRLFSVGSNVDAERISGKLSDHVLTVTVPKKNFQ